jgi:hypothetical protein
MPRRLRLAELPLVALASFCAGFAGDTVLRTAYPESSASTAASLFLTRETSGESRFSAILDSAISGYFKSIDVAGSSLEIRIPFGQNGERGKGVFDQEFFAGGRAEPEASWARIEEVLASDDFRYYASALLEPGEGQLSFDLASASWSLESREEAEEAGPEGGPDGDVATSKPPFSRDARVAVTHRGPALDESAIYDYLYCVARIGLDCAGFVYNVEREAARALGFDLDASLAPLVGVDADRVRLMVGLWAFDPASGLSERVGEKLGEIRPGDIFLFRGKDGRFGHCAVVVSIDCGSGVLRYAQDTDWAPETERGVHESFILWTNGRGDLSLADPELRWLQSVRSAFPGEDAPMWDNDGERYRTEWPQGRSIVVRLLAMREAVEAAYPGFYGD